MSEILKPCLFVDKSHVDDVWLEEVLRPYRLQVRCGCGARGPWAPTEAEAIATWNALPRPAGVAEFLAAFDAWEKAMAYWDRANRVLYVCPLPCVVVRLG